MFICYKSASSGKKYLTKFYCIIGMLWKNGGQGLFPRRTFLRQHPLEKKNSILAFFGRVSF